jgi:outer membrane protein
MFERLPRHAVMPWMISAGLMAAIILIAAESRPPARVAVVDADRVQRKSVSIQAGLAKASGPANRIQEELKAKTVELGRLMDEYQTQQAAASKEVNAQRMEKIVTLRREVAELNAQFDAALKKAGDTELEPMRQRIFDAVNRLAQEQGIEVVLSTQGVLYYAPYIDLTEQVVTRLDKDAGAGQ